jgi:hypothetical protein
MLTLIQQAEADNDELALGVIKTVTAQNQIAGMMPSKAIDGFVYSYTREKAGFNQRSLVNTYNTAGANIENASQPFERKRTQLTEIIGQIELSPLIAQQASSYNDALAAQASATMSGMSKEYSAQFMDGNAKIGFISGSAFTPELDGILKLALNPEDYAQVNTQAKRAASSALLIGNNVAGHSKFTGTITSGTGSNEVLTANGAIVLEAASAAVYGLKGFDGINSFLEGSDNDVRSDYSSRSADGEEFISRLETFANLVNAKTPGAPDFVMMSSRGMNRYYSALRSVGALSTVQEVELSSGKSTTLQTFRGVPMFVNNYIGHGINDNLDGDNKAGNLAMSSSATDDVYMGTFDDGGLNGICGLHGKESMGVDMKDLGPHQTKNLDLHRITWSAGLVSYSESGLMRGTI